MDRRDFIKRGATGLFGLAATSSTIAASLGRVAEAIPMATKTFDLDIDEALVEMVDETPVYMWLYADKATGTPHYPGPLLLANDGDEITVNLRNLLDEEHSFVIPGVVDSGPIAPAGSATVTFMAPAPGQYLYHDALNAPVNRVLGLHGMLMVMPLSGNTPYASPTPQVQMLFDDMGTAPLFPGDAWTWDRTWIWILGNVDPAFNALAAAGTLIDPTVFSNDFTTRYFLINGKSGWFAHHDHMTMLAGNVGQPALVRVVNPGMNIHSLHWHANHLYEIAVNAQVSSNLLLLDAVTFKPMTSRDLVFPFIKPPDIPDEVWPPRQENFPLTYPMHCHNEPSQTANGGSYPQGMVTMMEFTGAGPGKGTTGPTGPFSGHM
jgi:hypothetical protein